MRKNTQKSSRLKSFISSPILASGILLVVFSIYAFIHTNRHANFYTTGWDLAVFDQPVHLLSHGQTPFSSLHNTHTLGDHFHPLMLIMGATLYKIWPDPRMLLWLETAIAVSSGGVLYILSKGILRPFFTKTSLYPQLISLSLSLMYLFSVGFQAMLLDDFHDDVLITLPLILLFWFLYKQNWKWYWVTIVWVLLTKEEFGLLVAAIGCVVTLKGYFKQGIGTMVIGVISFFVLLQVIMPKFAAGTYWKYGYRHYSDTNRPSVVMKRFVLNPSLFIITLVDDPQKRYTLTSGIFSFGFLPLAVPIHLLPAAETLLIRFIDNTAPLRFAFNNHYNGPYIPLLAIASVYGTATIISRWKKKHVPTMLVIWIIGITIVQNVLFHGPINSLAKKEFYQPLNWKNDANALISHVPKSSSLATQNFLLPHLSQRTAFTLLPETNQSEYIAAMLINHPTDFYGPNLEKLKTELAELTKSGKYQIVWQQNQAVLLKKVE